METIVVLGGGESGVGSAVLAKVKGHEVFLSDGGTLREEYRRKLEEYNVEFEQGGHTAGRILAADTIVKSPGIPDKAEIVREARAAAIPVISEIEFASRYCTARKICITGSNGKTTTTTLIYETMLRAGMNVAVAGNIGESFAWKIATSEIQYDWYVLELSSFQLDGMYDFRADIALLLNITPDHLDRYEYKLENYVASKLRILRNQRPEDTLIYNQDDPLSSSAILSADIASAAVPFSVHNTGKGAWFDGVNLHYKDFSIAAADMKIRGLHNIANGLAAIVAVREAGVSNEFLADSLRNFGGVEHRLEPVRTVGGIEYINDSKATNVDSTWFALESMTRPTIWIAGGTDKGNDYSILEDLVRKNVKALICMGVDNSKLMDSFRDIVPIIEDTHSLDDAIAAVTRLAESGDAVLLSPACASFDLFQNYENRGKLFKDKVLKL